MPSGGGVKLVKHGQRPNQFGGALDGSPLEVPPICGPLGTLACLRVRGQPRQLPSSRVELITTVSPPPPLHAGGGRRHCAPHCPRTRRHARVPKGPQIGGASNGDPSNAPPNWFGRCPCFTNLTPPPDGNAASGRPEAASGQRRRQLAHFSGTTHHNVWYAFKLWYGMVWYGMVWYGMVTVCRRLLNSGDCVQLFYCRLDEDEALLL